MGLNKDSILQQDNEPKYVARKTKKFLQESDVQLVERTAQSTDQIENLWCLLDYKKPLNRRNTEAEFLNILHLELTTIDKKCVEELVNNLSCLPAIVKYKGGNTKYLFVHWRLLSMTVCI